MATYPSAKSRSVERLTLLRQFVARLGSDSPPTIDAFVARADEESRPALLLELVCAEFEHRIDAGDRPRLEEYLQHFPSLVRSNGQVPGRLVQLGERATTFFGAATISEPASNADSAGASDVTTAQCLEAVDVIADAFEQAWKNGESPSIEVFLKQADPQVQSKLMIELACIEYECRINEGKPCRIEEFAERFPSLRGEDGQLIAPLRRWAIMLAANTATASARAGHYSAEFPTIHGYDIVSKLGEGGMGAVYRAVQLSTKRTVALKVMKGDFSSAWRDRFAREVQLSARLQHPNIAPVFDSGLMHDNYWYAMEFIDGRRLDHYVLEKKLKSNDVARIVARVCRTMDYAHSQGVLHRDLKPSNVLITADGHPRVVDFGLAKSTSGDSSVTLTRSDTPLGTPEYMSPEQTGGRHEDHTSATDVYGLGAILYRLLTGEPPFRGTPLAVIHKVMYDDPERPRGVNPSIDADLEAITLKAMQKDPSQRYESAAAMADDLDRYLSNETVHARAANWWNRLMQWSSQTQRIRLGSQWGIFVGAILASIHIGIILFNIVGNLWGAQVAELGKAELFAMMGIYLVFLDLPYLLLARRLLHGRLFAIFPILLADAGILAFGAVMVVMPSLHPMSKLYQSPEVLRTVALFLFVIAATAFPIHLIALKALLSNRQLLAWRGANDPARGS